MENTSPGMQVCPFCGKAFKRLKAHLPHCKLARNGNCESNSKKTQVPIAIPQLKLNCKPIESPASPSKKIKIKANSGKTLTQKESASLTKQNKSIGLWNESYTSEQTVRSKGINEPQSSQGDLMDKREPIRKKSQYVSRTTKVRSREAKKEMVIKTKSSEHFLKQDQDKVDVKLKDTRAKVKNAQKISNNSIKKEENIDDSSSRFQLNEKESADLVSKNVLFPKVKPVLNLEHIPTQPEFEETAVLDLQAHGIDPQSSDAVRSNSLHSIKQENMVPIVDIRCQSDQNKVIERMISNKLIYEPCIKTSVWHHIKENLCRTATSAKLDFISNVNTSVKEDDCRAEILATSHSNSSTSNHIYSVIMASMQVKDFNKYEGDPGTEYVAMKKMEPSDWTTNGLAQTEYLHLSEKENGWNKDTLLSTSTTKTEYLPERIKELHPSLCRKTGIGMEWFPELYPGYHSIGLSMLAKQTEQLETPIRLSASQSKNTKGYNEYYKYISTKRGRIGGVITLLLGCASLSYIWNYYCIKHNSWRKYL
ncbi:uncharacterized protein [Heterodontus francisci]|uniref:uncharacterized protein n=1 Tax=Heterodontus francisci TaxID=7792 RepID=UPI00355B465D